MAAAVKAALKNRNAAANISNKATIYLKQSNHRSHLDSGAARLQNEPPPTRMNVMRGALAPMLGAMGAGVSVVLLQEIGLTRSAAAGPPRHCGATKESIS